LKTIPLFFFKKDLAMGNVLTEFINKWKDIHQDQENVQEEESQTSGIGSIEIETTHDDDEDGNVSSSLRMESNTEGAPHCVLSPGKRYNANQARQAYNTTMKKTPKLFKLIPFLIWWTIQPFVEPCWQASTFGGGSSSGSRKSKKTSWKEIWRWMTKNENGQRETNKWIKALVARLVLLFLFMLLWNTSASRDAAIAQTFPSYIDSSGRTIFNTLNHPVQGSPWNGGEASLKKNRNNDDDDDENKPHLKNKKEEDQTTTGDGGFFRLFDWLGWWWWWWRPWQTSSHAQTAAYSQKECEWINQKSAQGFVRLNDTDLVTGHIEIQWMDDEKHNVSIEKLTRALSVIPLDEPCVCAAHLLIPFHIVRIASSWNQQKETSRKANKETQRFYEPLSSSLSSSIKPGQRILIEPEIRFASGPWTQLCFHDPLFPDSRMHFETEPTPSFSQTMMASTTTTSHQSKQQDQTRPVRRRDDDDEQDNKNDQTQRMKVERTETVLPSSSSFSTTPLPPPRFSSTTQQKTQCKSFPESILVQFHDYGTMGELVPRGREWFYHEQAACIIHCTLLAGRIMPLHRVDK